MTDRCAACFAPLVPAPLGGRYACTCSPPNAWRHLRGSYLTEAMPELGHTIEAHVRSRHGRPTLHLYGRMPR